ncbi:MAG: hypothetical protein ACI9XB_002837, partial [Gammaproteobacteria bacterium]
SDAMIWSVVSVGSSVVSCPLQDVRKSRERKRK